MDELKIKVDCFNLKYTLECGQCFRWKNNNDYYVGVIKDRVIKIRQDRDYIYVRSNEQKDLEKVVKEYFELEKDYSSIEKRIASLDDYVKKALKNTESVYVLCALVSITGILIHGFVDTVFFRPQIQFVFWTMAAIIRSLDGCREN